MNELLLEKEEKQLLLELICDKQIQMIMKNPTTYTSSDYRRLESLKITVKELETKGE